MNKGTWVALALALGVCGALAWVLSSQEGSSGVGREVSKAPLAANGDLAERVMALEADNRRMRNELSLTRTQAVDLQEQVERAAASGADAVEPEEGASPATTPQESDEARKTRVEASLVAFEDDLRAQVEVQHHDRARSTAIEQVFGSAIAEAGGTLTLESTSCGDSLCSVVVTHEDELGHTGLTSALQTRREQIGRALIRRHPRAAGGYQTTYFFSRPGEPLAQLDQALVGEYN